MSTPEMTASRASHDSRPSATRWLTLIGFILACEAAGATGALVTDPGFYQELNQPAWAPPPWLFGPVWVTLYAMMGVAGWMIWRRGGSMVMFAVQLALNAMWTPIFFGAHAVGAAFVVISLLDLAIFATIVGFGRRSQVAAWLLVPYAAWVGFATALTGALWLLNR